MYLKIAQYIRVLTCIGIVLSLVIGIYIECLWIDYVRITLVYILVGEALIEKTIIEENHFKKKIWAMVTTGYIVVVVFLLNLLFHGV